MAMPSSLFRTDANRMSTVDTLYGGGSGSGTRSGIFSSAGFTAVCTALCICAHISWFATLVILDWTRPWNLRGDDAVSRVRAAPQRWGASSHRFRMWAVMPPVKSTSTTLVDMEHAATSLIRWPSAVTDCRSCTSMLVSVMENDTLPSPWMLWITVDCTHGRHQPRARAPAAARLTSYAKSLWHEADSPDTSTLTTSGPGITCSDSKCAFPHRVLDRLP